MNKGGTGAGRGRWDWGNEMGQGVVDCSHLGDGSSCGVTLGGVAGLGATLEGVAGMQCCEVVVGLVTAEKILAKRWMAWSWAWPRVTNRG